MADKRPIKAASGVATEFGTGDTVGVGNGGTGQTTLASAIESLLASISATQGVMLIRGSSAWAALAAGASGKILTAAGAGADPFWGDFRVQVKSKSASQSVNNSTTLVNDNHISFAVAANKSYKFLGLLLGTWTTGAFKYAFTVPSGATGKVWCERGAATNSMGGVVDLTTGGSTTSTNLTNAPILIAGYIDTVGNAGNLQLQFAQQNPQTNNTTLLQASTILCFEG